MPLSNQVLIVESSRQTISEIIADLTQLNVKADFRVALNNGHALLHIKHLHLESKIDTIKLLVILNIHTPISNGFDFFKGYNSDEEIDKNKIKILVFEDNLSPWEKEDLEGMGIIDFVSFPLTEEKEKNIINSYFHPSDPPQTEPIPAQNTFSKKKDRKNRKGFHGSSRI